MYAFKINIFREFFVERNYMKLVAYINLEM